MLLNIIDEVVDYEEMGSGTYIIVGSGFIGWITYPLYVNGTHA
jgi:hypothetical protein